MSIEKPFWKKKTWWGTTIAGILGAATIYLRNPTPMGIIEAAIALATAVGLFGISEVARVNAAANVRNAQANADRADAARAELQLRSK